jgi:hypothetical protein
MTAAQRLIDAAKHAHAQLGEATLDLHRIEQRLARVRSQLGYAVTMYEPDTATQPPDPEAEPRD